MKNVCDFCGSSNLGRLEHDTVSVSEDPQYAVWEDIYYRECCDCGELAGCDKTGRTKNQKTLS